ncbi:hypothetical protein P167DRAFT_140093 [Morchella conica CCBAS932]|uniref:Uncharacterized protein n=1 Tax=Morchella conica CCBAS932 TaxID=1392247 RepID=A0A3N4KQY4_9PEZI|nr:hypothetical protein P167DRAFT_140093 [Morchella conica CCBAS932]
MFTKHPLPQTPPNHCNIRRNQQPGTNDYKSQIHQFIPSPYPHAAPDPAPDPAHPVHPVDPHLCNALNSCASHARYLISTVSVSGLCPLWKEKKKRRCLGQLLKLWAEGLGSEVVSGLEVDRWCQ